MLIYFLKDVDQSVILTSEFYFSSLILYIEIFILVIFCVCLIIFQNYILNFGIPILEFCMLLVLVIQAMLLLIKSNNLILCFLVIELQSLCVYILVSLKKNSIFSLESGIKYFVYSAVMSAILIFGISLIYMQTGHVSLYDLQFYIGEPNLMFSLGIFFLLSGVLFKLAVVPFHF